MKRLQKTIAECLEFVARNQQADGGFVSNTSFNKDFKNSETHFTVFYPALILQNLSGLPSSSTKNRLASFLHKQAGPNGAYNYWQRTSSDFTQQPYPDDLDDTFCVLAGLYLHDTDRVNGRSLAQAVQLLTAAELKPGGPYKTWLVGPKSAPEWQDVDPAVNINIAYFLSLLEVELPGLKQFGRLKSPYYDGQLPLIWLLSRLGPDKHGNALVGRILAMQKSDGSWGNPLRTAMALAALQNLSFVDVDRAIRNLAGQPAWALCRPYRFGIERVQHGRKYYSGSAAFTASLCALVLQRHLQSKNKKPKFDTVPQTVQNQIVGLAKQRARQLGAIGQSLLPWIDKQAKVPEITLLPFWFGKALVSGCRPPRSLVVKLGLASLWGWITYTIYDNFLDNDGLPEQLPVANIAFRELSAIYSDLDLGLFVETSNRMELANAWEVANTRTITNPPDYSDYNQLSEKSIGHALGPMYILRAGGFKRSSADYKNIEMFFRHYLIARQLNDDAHDWSADLGKSQVNSVAALMLKRGKKLTELKDYFGQKVIFEIADLIHKHLDRAERHLKAARVIADKQFFDEPMQSLRRAADKAVKQGKIINAFLDAYTPKN